MISGYHKIHNTFINNQLLKTLAYEMSLGQLLMLKKGYTVN